MWTYGQYKRLKVKGHPIWYSVQQAKNNVNYSTSTMVNKHINFINLLLVAFTLCTVYDIYEEYGLYAPETMEASPHFEKINELHLQSKRSSEQIFPTLSPAIWCQVANYSWRAYFSFISLCVVHQATSSTSYNQDRFMKLGHKMPEDGPFTLHSIYSRALLTLIINIKTLSVMDIRLPVSINIMRETIV